jgi:hypothetical protein
MTIRRQVLLTSVVAVAYLSFTPSPLHAQDDEDLSALPPEGSLEEDASNQPIAVELAQGIDLLNQQITSQQELLKTAQTEREQQLIKNHIRLLQKERRSLESLLNKLVGPGVDILEAAREAQTERQSERDLKTLEKEERIPQQ